MKTDELMKTHETYLKRIDDLNDPIWQEAIDILTITSPKVVGISAYSASFKSAVSLSEIIKRHFPEILIVMGGIHPTIDPKSCLRLCKTVDVIVVGESELTAPPLFSSLLRGDMAKENLLQLKGIAFRDKDEIITTEPAEPVADLDSIPLPARHLMIDLDKMPPHAHESIYGFRGCPFQCIFCGSFNVFGRKPRMRSAESLAQEIKNIHHRYGTRYFYICDDIFFIKKERALKFCELLANMKLSVYYSVQSRGEMLDPDVLKALKKTGCQHIAIGVEVGDENIRMKIKKGNTVEDMKIAAKKIKENKLRMVGFFMFGFPWETKEDMLKTLNLMEELNPIIAFPYIVTPAVGTELYDISQNMGLISDAIDYSSFSHISPKMGLTQNISEEERKPFIDSILDKFAAHNKKSLKWDFFKRPGFYLAAANDAGLFSSSRIMMQYINMLFN